MPKLIVKNRICRHLASLPRIKSKTHSHSALTRSRGFRPTTNEITFFLRVCVCVCMFRNLPVARCSDMFSCSMYLYTLTLFIYLFFGGTNERTLAMWMFEEKPLSTAEKNLDKEFIFESRLTATSQKLRNRRVHENIIEFWFHFVCLPDFHRAAFSVWQLLTSINAKMSRSISNSEESVYNRLTLNTDTLHSHYCTPIIRCDNWITDIALFCSPLFVDSMNCTRRWRTSKRWW